MSVFHLTFITVNIVYLEMMLASIISSLFDIRINKDEMMLASIANAKWNVPNVCA